MNMKTLLKGELIGLEAEITDSENKRNIGIKGKIIDETQNTFTIKGKKTWMVVKKQNIFLFKTKNKKIKINGKLIVKRPEERIKIRNIKWLEKQKK